LERSITNKEDCSAVLASILSSESSTLASTNGPADTAPENLAEGCDIARESSVPDAEVSGTSLSDDNIIGDEIFADAGPEPGLCDGLGVVVVLLNLVPDLGNGRSRHRLGVDLVDDLAEDTAHGNAGVCGVPDLAVSAVEINRVDLRCAVGETSGVEITLQSTNGEKEIRVLDNGLGTSRVRAVTSKDTTIVGVVLVHCALAHGGDKDREVELVNKLVNFFDNTVADSARVDEDDRALGGVHGLEDLVNNKVLVARVVLGLRKVNGGVETGTLNLLLDHIGRDHDVDGTRAEPAGAESSVDLLGNLRGLVELGDVAGDLRAHVGKDVEVTVAESVVKKHLVTLRDGRGASNNVDDRNVLRVRSSNTVDGRELANTECGDESSHFGNTSVAIGSVGCKLLLVNGVMMKLFRWSGVMMKLTSIELVNTADPLEVALRKIVEGDEVVITGNTVNRSNADLVESLEEVLSHVNGLLKAAVAHGCGLIGGRWNVVGKIRLIWRGKR
jgi:hypothetical protein